MFSGKLASYRVSSNSNGVLNTVDILTGRDGRDGFVNIERLKFTDTMLTLDIAPNQTAGSVYMLYQAIFNPKPDAAGLGYWINAVDKCADIVKNVASTFVSSNEFITKYVPSSTNGQFVDNLYLNVLHRQGEAGGALTFGIKYSMKIWLLERMYLKHLPLIQNALL